ncbi:uncharacterized protein BDR25DRAFT_327285 [Lindgomyces ingoldianus]|uniref:Uncharacterized protein n=1 Tax=Lindgomyces ingoldianus TaxID=673940 RepID=A0ACB6QK56_9PLEO|nr:uncharacterized protein BDR25DRAFT_327285 [Lindgomyces ingoldianus]KAF2467383.1 hypothetical protein BDR25DRAFT_327285 [Lindgomyces ingoldianus]
MFVSRDASFDLLNDKRFGQLCGTACAQDLETSREAIKRACISAADVMVPGGSVACPGLYCDSVVSQWLNQSSSGNWTVAQNCSDCELGVQKLQLSSPFGYDVDGAANFASLTSNCQAGGYTYATPTTYAINAIVVPDPPSRTCTSSYTVQDGDTCVSISLSRNVSTYDLIRANGSTICLPNICNTHLLDVYDRCDNITAGAHINRQQLLSWNPMINHFKAPYLSSSSVESSWVLTTIAAHQTEQSTQVKATLSPQTYLSPQMHRISPADTVGSGMLPKRVDRKCSNFRLGTSYSVRPAGNIATYSGYPMPTPNTVFPKPTPEPTSIPPPVVTPPLSAAAAGTVDRCLYYMNAFDESISNVFDLKVANSCKDLLAWNPSLSKENCMLQPGKSYCILKSLFR